MTHTETSRERHSSGDLIIETLEIDISSLDSQGTETGVSPSHVDVVKTSVADVLNAQGTGDFHVTWNETSSELRFLNESGSQPANNAAINDTRITWWGTP